MHRVVGFLFLAASLQLGCETRVSLGSPCASDDECEGALRCDYGRCRTECDESSDCGGDRYCLTINATEGVCTLPTDVCDEATRLHCEDGLACVDQACVAPCAASTRTCLPGTFCSVGESVCVPAPSTPDAGVDAGMSVVDTSADTSSLVDAACEVEAVPTHRSLCIGRGTACAIVSGQVRCWGSNSAGQLGDGASTTTRQTHQSCAHPTGTFDCSSTPVTVLREDGTALNDVQAIACGELHVCALTRAGAVACWGYPEVLGTDSPHGDRAAIVMTGASSIVAGSNHTCARVGTHFRCWGKNAQSASLPVDHRLGNAEREAATPTDSFDFDSFDRIEAGGTFTCGVRCGEVRCQGLSEAAVCGNDYPEPDSPGVVVAEHRGIRDTAGVIDDLHTGEAHACFVRDGVVSCWGADQFSVLASEVDRQIRCSRVSYTCRNYPSPVRVSLSPTPRFLALAHGIAATSCAVDTMGAVYCWGDNTYGQAGYASADLTVDSGMGDAGPPNAQVGSLIQAVRDGSGPLSGMVEVAVGWANACARDATGQVYCWGENDAGQLGRPGVLESFDPTARAISL